MLTFFLFVFYFTCGTLLLHLILRWRKFPFTIYHTTAIVGFKLLLGGLYGYIFLNHYGGDDTWHYFRESKELSDALIHHPAAFFQEILPANSLQATGNAYGSALLFYIRHFEGWFMPRLLAMLNFLTGKNYYLDLVWFDFIVLAGPLLLFKILHRRYPEKRGLFFLIVFFIPTITFWCSGIRAEALILFFVTWVLYQVIRYADRPAARHLLQVLAGLCCIVLFRPFLLALLLPALLAFYFSLRNPGRGPKLFVAAWLAVAAIFFAGFLLPDALRPSSQMIATQQAFFNLKAHTRYPLDSLTENPLSFIHILPQATVNSSFRPYPWEGKGLLQSVSAAESLLLVVALIYFLLSRYNAKPDPLLWFFLFFGITQLIAIGYLVPFPGAIVRYRSIPLLFLLFFLFYGNEPVHQKLNLLIGKE